MIQLCTGMSKRWAADQSPRVKSLMADGEKLVKQVSLKHALTHSELQLPTRATSDAREQESKCADGKGPLLGKGPLGSRFRSGGPAVGKAVVQ